jgi:hypothetical protein
VNEQVYRGRDYRGGGTGWFPPTVGGLASLGAGAIHLALTPAHLDEWWGYGAFFLALGLFQSAYGLPLLVPRLASWFMSRYALAGAIVNIAVIGLYIVTRTVGIPLGPEAGEVEGVGISDTISKFLEVLLAGILIRHFIRYGRYEPR